MNISLKREFNSWEVDGGDCLSSDKVYAADYLGVIPYGEALRLQQKLVKARDEGRIPDVVLLLQHPPVFTLGKFRGEREILASPELLAQKGIEVYKTSRGGSVTYHGPGQLVGYPILKLKDIGLSVREYIWKLEEVIIRLLQTLDIDGYRVPRHLAGIWAQEKKICSIGIRVAHYITMHGFALNVSDNLQNFEYINPCGLKGDNIMTSVSQLLGNHVGAETLVDNVLECFSEVFGLRCEKGLEKCRDIIDVPSG